MAESNKQLPSWEPHGLAIQAYWKGELDAKIGIHLIGDESVEMPAEIYFRSLNEMPEIEQKALSLCRGKVLDVGAGAGSHALQLMEQGLEVQALDIDPSCVRIMQERGVKNTACGDFLAINPKERFDTLVFLMNGIGIAGNCSKLLDYLRHSHALTTDSGQVLLDSSDLRISNPDLEPKPGYFGEIDYQLSYDGIIGSPYTWLYVDFESLSALAVKTAWQADLIDEMEDGHYLARLSKKTA